MSSCPHTWLSLVPEAGPPSGGRTASPKGPTQLRRQTQGAELGKAELNQLVLWTLCDTLTLNQTEKLRGNRGPYF